MRKTASVYANAVRRNKAVMAILFAGLMLFGAILTAFHALWQQNHSAASSVREDALWVSYQINRQATKFAEVLHDITDHPTPASLSELNLNFDLLYSTHEVMEDADFPAKFRNDPKLKKLNDDVAAILHRMVPVFDRVVEIGVIDPTVFPALEEDANSLREATAKLLLETHLLRAEFQSEAREETSRIYALLVAAIAATTLAMGTVIVMIWRQLHQIEIARFRLQRLSEELAQSAASAEAGAKAKSTFLATMSHEIRTPLNGIVGMAELLASTPLDAGQRDRLGTIRQCSDGLITLIDDILDFSKLESGKIDLEHRPMDLGEIVDGVVDMFAPRAEAKGIELVADHPSATYVGDPARFRQILVNLVGNAVKFTDRGTVAIRMEEVTRSEGKTDLVVEVEDTGIGISAENQKRLFREFTQADASINRRFGGTGLGLAIIRRIVEALGGDVRVDSRLGRGSTFRFEIPVEKVEGGEAKTMAAGLDVRVEAAAPLVAGVVERSLARLGRSAHRAAAGTTRRRVVLYDADAFAEAMLSGHVSTSDEVVVFGRGARAFASEAADVVEGPMTPRRLARLLAHRAAGTHYGGNPSPFVGEAVDDAPIGQGLVLVVEDNLVNQTVARGLLMRLGLSVEVVADGAAAVERAARGGLAAVLMDMQMPVMDGLEATRRIRALPGPAARTPIIGLTANAFVTDREACLAAGMDDFLSKPVTRDKLAGVLRPFVTTAKEPVESDEPATAIAEGDAVVDRAHRDGLVEALGAEGLAELDAIFRADAESLMQEIARAREAGDLEGLRRSLHTLKGAAANVGFVGVVAAIDEIRAKGAFDRPEAFGGLAARLLAGWRVLAEEGAAEVPPSRAAQVRRA